MAVKKNEIDIRGPSLPEATPRKLSLEHNTKWQKPKNKTAGFKDPEGLKRYSKPAGLKELNEPLKELLEELENGEWTPATSIVSKMVVVTSTARPVAVTRAAKPAGLKELNGPLKELYKELENVDWTPATSITTKLVVVTSTATPVTAVTFVAGVAVVANPLPGSMATSIISKGKASVKSSSKRASKAPEFTGKPTTATVTEKGKPTTATVTEKGTTVTKTKDSPKETKESKPKKGVTVTEKGSTVTEKGATITKTKDSPEKTRESKSDRGGKEGEHGRDGKHGGDGKDGKDGKQGKDGKSGGDGKDGKDGKDGSQGKGWKERKEDDRNDAALIGGLMGGGLGTGLAVGAAAATLPGIAAGGIGNAVGVGAKAIGAGAGAVGSVVKGAAGGLGGLFGGLGKLVGGAVGGLGSLVGGAGTAAASVAPAVVGAAVPAIAGAAPVLAGAVVPAIAGAAPVIAGAAVPALAGAAIPALAGAAVPALAGAVLPAVAGAAAPAIMGAAVPALAGAALPAIAGVAAPAIMGAAVPALAGAAIPALAGAAVPALAGAVLPAVAGAAVPAVADMALPKLAGMDIPAAGASTSSIDSDASELAVWRKGGPFRGGGTPSPPVSWSEVANEHTLELSPEGLADLVTHSTGDLPADLDWGSARPKEWAEQSLIPPFHEYAKPAYKEGWTGGEMGQTTANANSGDVKAHKGILGMHQVGIINHGSSTMYDLVPDRVWDRKKAKWPKKPTMGQGIVDAQYDTFDLPGVGPLHGIEAVQGEGTGLLLRLDMDPRIAEAADPVDWKDLQDDLLHNSRHRNSLKRKHGTQNLRSAMPQDLANGAGP